MGAGNKYKKGRYSYFLYTRDRRYALKIIENLCTFLSGCKFYLFKTTPDHRTMALQVYLPLDLHLDLHLAVHLHLHLELHLDLHMDLHLDMYLHLGILICISSLIHMFTNFLRYHFLKSLRIYITPF